MKSGDALHHLQLTVTVCLMRPDRIWSISLSVRPALRCQEPFPEWAETSWGHKRANLCKSCPEICCTRSESRPCVGGEMVADTVPCQNVLSMPEGFPIFLPNLHRSKNLYWKSNRQLSLGFIGS